MVRLYRDLIMLLICAEDKHRRTTCSRMLEFETTDSSKSVTSLLSSDGVLFLDKDYINDCPTAATEPCIKVKADECDDDNGNDTQENNGVDEGSSPLSVHFHRTITIRGTRHHRNYTRHEKIACWYQPWEFAERKENCIQDIKRWQDDGEDQTDDESYCSRGLESLEPVAARQKRKLRQKTENTVFVNQYIGADDNTIAIDYSALTSRSQMLANFVGLSDQREAESCYYDDYQKEDQ